MITQNLDMFLQVATPLLAVRGAYSSPTDCTDLTDFARAALVLLAAYRRTFRSLAEDGSHIEGKAMLTSRMVLRVITMQQSVLSVLSVGDR